MFLSIAACGCYVRWRVVDTDTGAVGSSGTAIQTGTCNHCRLPAASRNRLCCAQCRWLIVPRCAALFVSVSKEKVFACLLHVGRMYNKNFCKSPAGPLLSSRGQPLRGLQNTAHSLSFVYCFLLGNFNNAFFKFYCRAVGLCSYKSWVTFQLPPSPAFILFCSSKANKHSCRLPARGS